MIALLTSFNLSLNQHYVHKILKNYNNKLCNLIVLQFIKLKQTEDLKVFKIV